MSSPLRTKQNRFAAFFHQSFLQQKSSLFFQCQCAFNRNKNVTSQVKMLLTTNTLQNEREPFIELFWSLGWTNSVMLLSSNALKTNGSLISLDLIVLTARNSPVNGSCLYCSTFPLTFTARLEPWVTSTSPEMQRGLNPSRCLLSTLINRESAK